MSPIPWTNYHINAALKTSNTTYPTQQWISKNHAWDLHCPDPIHNYFMLYTVISLAKELPRCTKIYHLAQLLQILELFQNDRVKCIDIIIIICIYYWHAMQVSMASILCAVPNHGTKPPLHWYGSTDASFHTYMCKNQPRSLQHADVAEECVCKGQRPKA